MPHNHTMVILWGYTGSGKTTLFNELCKQCARDPLEPLKIFDAREYCDKKSTQSLPHMPSSSGLTQSTRRIKPVPINNAADLEAFLGPRSVSATTANPHCSRSGVVIEVGTDEDGGRLYIMELPGEENNAVRTDGPSTIALNLMVVRAVLEGKENSISSGIAGYLMRLRKSRDIDLHLVACVDVSKEKETMMTCSFLRKLQPNLLLESWGGQPLGRIRFH